LLSLKISDTPLPIPFASAVIGFVGIVPEIAHFLPRPKHRAFRVCLSRLIGVVSDMA
jgi:hypothetical protein